MGATAHVSTGVSKGGRERTRLVEATRGWAAKASGAGAVGSVAWEWLEQEGKSWASEVDAA